MNLRPFHTALACLLVCLCLSQPRAQGVTTKWTNPAGGSFSDPANWDNGVPGSADTAQYDLTNNGVTQVTGSFDTDTILLNSNFSGFVTTAISVDAASTLTAADKIEVVTGSLTLEGEGGVTAGVLALSQESDLILQSGIKVTVTGDLIGASNNGTPRDWLIKDPGTRLDVQGTAILGNYGGDSFRVNADTEVLTGSTQMNSEAELILDGGSLSTGALTNTSGGTLDVRYGSLNVSGGAFQPGGTGFKLQGNALGPSSLTLETNATFDASGELIVADIREGALQIVTGSSVSSTVGTIGDQATGNGQVTVSGSGSTWNSSGNLRIGRSGVGTLRVEDGGTVTNLVGWLGVGNGSQGTATVTGAGSTWTSSSTLNVGAVGSGILRIEDGGAVENLTALVGRDPGASGSVTVTGAGSTWTNNGNVRIGRDGSGLVLVENGGAASSIITEVGELTSVNGQLYVIGAGSLWSSSDSLIVGGSGVGRIFLENGGAATSARGFIGQDAGSFGSVFVNGSGSSWSSETIYVGGDSNGIGGTGELNISDDATVHATDLLLVWPDGTVSLSGGALLKTPTLFLDAGGAFNFTGGELNVDRVTGTLTQDGGVVTIGDSVGHTTVDRLQMNAGTIEIDLAGTGQAGIDYDLFEVTGLGVIISGSIEVSLIDGFSPIAGDMFEPYQAKSLASPFSTVTLPSLTGFLSWTTEYDDSVLRLIVETPFSADFDGDGDVDASDLADLQAAFGNNADGDTDEDGDTDLADLLTLQREYTGDLSPPPEVAVVPEPAAGLIALSLAAMLGLRQRRIVE